MSQDVGHLILPSLEIQTKVCEWMSNEPTALEDVARQVGYGCSEVNIPVSNNELRIFVGLHESGSGIP